MCLTCCKKHHRKDNASPRPSKTAILTASILTTPNTPIERQSQRSPLRTIVDPIDQGELNRQYIAEVEAMRREYQFSYDRYQVNLHEEELSMSSVDKNTITEIIDLPQENMYSSKDVLTRKRYKLEKCIGSGSYGTVWRARYHSLSPSVSNPTKTSGIVAVKVMNYERSERARLLSHLKAEIYVLEKYPHPNIITLYDHFVIDNKAYLIMEFADGGTLNDLLKKVGPLDESSAYYYFVQILKGIFYLHTFAIAHRDLKTENVLLVSSRTVPKVLIAKISDFGLSKQIYKPKLGIIKAGNYAGTRDYMAPEILCCSVYSEFENEFEFDAFKCDLWAMGVILYEMLCGETPFERYHSSEEIYRAQYKRRWSFPKDAGMSENVKALIRSLLQPNPNLRIDLNSILNHPWIQSNYITNKGWSPAHLISANPNFKKPK